MVLRIEKDVPFEAPARKEAGSEDAGATRPSSLNTETLSVTGLSEVLVTVRGPFLSSLREP